MTTPDPRMLAFVASHHAGVLATVKRATSGGGPEPGRRASVPQQAVRDHADGQVVER